MRGHAIEARIYAEDCDAIINEKGEKEMSFLPSPGKIEYLREPWNRNTKDVDPDVRIDTGIIQGDTISTNFDPMISKLIVWGETWDDAIWKM